ASRHSLLCPVTALEKLFTLFPTSPHAPLFPALTTNHFQNNISFSKFTNYSSMPASLQSVFLVILFGKERQPQLMPRAFPNTTSSFSAAGKAMLSTITLTSFKQQLTYKKFSSLILNFSPLLLNNSSG